MFNNIKAGVTGVVLAVLAFGGFSVALAASSRSGLDLLKAPVAALSAAAPAAAGTKWTMGQISAIGSDNFTFKAPLGGAHVVVVNDQTLYFGSDAQASNFAGLKVGDRVLDAAATSADGKVTAKLVIDLGVKTGHRGQSGPRDIGVVTAVNSNQQSFTFKDRQGKVSELFTDTNTTITDRAGGATTFADIQSGARLVVRAEQRADGKWWAVAIRLGQPAKTTKPPASAGTAQS
jgi:hypothetical protein